MKHERRGVSLIEAIVAVAMSGIVLVSGVGMVHLVLDVERTARKSAQLSTAGARLSQVFRQDVHQATRFAAPTEEGAAANRVELWLPTDRAVEYEVRANRLARIERVGGQTRHQDEFVFPARCQISLVTRPDPDRIAVRIEQPATHAAGIPPSAGSPGPGPGGGSLRLEATVARDHRFRPVTVHGERVLRPDSRFPEASG
jgi:hypothetical protein